MSSPTPSVTIRLDDNAPTNSPFASAKTNGQQGRRVIMAGLAIVGIGLIVALGGYLHQINSGNGVGWGLVLGLLIGILCVGGGIYRQFFVPSPAGKLLLGGELQLRVGNFCHCHPHTGMVHYQLTASDKAVIDAEQAVLTIYDGNDKPLYCLGSFSHASHLTAAHALLTGQAVKTQGKAIALASPTNQQS